MGNVMYYYVLQRNSQKFHSVTHIPCQEDPFYHPRYIRKSNLPRTLQEHEAWR